MDIDRIASYISLPKISRDILGFLLPGMTLLILLYYSDYPPLRSARETTEFGNIGNILVCLTVAYAAGRFLFEISTLIFRTAYFLRKKIEKANYFFQTSKQPPRSQNKILETDVLSFLHQNPLLAAEVDRQTAAIFFSKGMVGASIVPALLVDLRYFIVTIIFILSFWSAEKNFIQSKKYVRYALQREQQKILQTKSPV